MKDIFQNYNFCPVCAGKLINKSPDFSTCQKCGYEFYRNSVPAVCAIIYQDDKIILAKKNQYPGRGDIDSVGGFLNYGEDPINGLKREIKEELGVKIKNINFFGIYIGEYKINENTSKKTFNIYYTCNLCSDKIKLSHEIVEVRWFSKNNIPFEQFAFEYEKQVIKDFFKQKHV